MKSICFFNHYHNGDLFNSKSFISEIINSIDTKFYYSHSNHPNVLKDLKVEFKELPVVKHNIKFFEKEDIFYINTWIGAYFDNPNEDYYGECSIRFLYVMFSKIYKEINQVFGTNLELKQVSSYIPFVDYTKFDISNVDKFLEVEERKKILFSNGPCLSFQCDYTGNMAEMINYFATNNRDKIFIATQKFETSLENVKFTSDIIKVPECDLNEISYLSKFCSMIVGRNSGPFCFTNTNENINDPNKIFYAFGDKETDCIICGLDIESNFIFEYYSSIKQIKESIGELIEQL